MRQVVEPRQKMMFDPFDGVISPAGWTRISNGWQGVFREVVLELLPVDQLARHFHRWHGRPSTELYAMAGLVLIKEFQNWTVPEAVDAVLFRADVQYALNLQPGFSISQRTVERFLSLFASDGALAQAIMVHVTDTLAGVLELKVSQAPQTALADAIYGSDENVPAATVLGVEIVSPVCGRKEQDATDHRGPEDFVLDPLTHTVTACPAGFVPLESLSFAQTDRVTVKMSPATCASCSLLSRCAMQHKTEVSKLYFTTKEHRLGVRRKNQETPEFRNRDSKRSGIEGTNSGLKRRLGLGRLRVRGSPAVHHALLLKVTGWNILRASTTETLRALVRERLLKAGRLGGLCAVFASLTRAWSSQWSRPSLKTASPRQGRVNLSMPT